MNALVQQHCILWNTGVINVSGQRLLKLHRLVPDWHIIACDQGTSLRRIFHFSSFSEALAFADRVGRLAQDEGYFPELVVGWGKVQVSWGTPRLKGLYVNDFIQAAKTDALCLR